MKGTKVGIGGVLTEAEKNNTVENKLVREKRKLKVQYKRMADDVELHPELQAGGPKWTGLVRLNTETGST